MSDRKAFNIKWMLGAYNLFQVIVCVHLIHKVSTPHSYRKSKPTKHTTTDTQHTQILTTEIRMLAIWQCTPAEADRHSAKSIATLDIMYTTFLMKIVELVETVFFVLRHKGGQITALHVYHHVSTVLLSWSMVKYEAGGMIMFTIWLNMCVHMVMYSYYFAALFGRRVQLWLGAVKRRLTMFQMVSCAGG